MSMVVADVIGGSASIAGGLFGARSAKKAADAAADRKLALTKKLTH